MPITFRCQSCRNKLSTAKRKAGSTVTCPGCGSEVRVPTASEKLDPQVERLLATAGGRAEYQAAPEDPLSPDDSTPDFGPKDDPPSFEPEPKALPPEPPPPPKTPTARRAKPITKPAPAPMPQSKLNDLPLFEREDFAEMLEKDTEEEDEEEPLPLPKESPPTTAADGFLVTRGTATLVMVAVVVLLGLAFAAGFLVGNRG